MNGWQMSCPQLQGRHPRPRAATVSADRPAVLHRSGASFGGGRRRARLRPRPEPARVTSTVAATSIECAHDYDAPSWTDRVRSLPRHQQGLRPRLGQSLPRPRSALGFNNQNTFQVTGGPARQLLPHRRRLRTPSTAATACSPATCPCCPRAAYGYHPEQAALQHAGRDHERSPRATGTASCPSMTW